MFWFRVTKSVIEWSQGRARFCSFRALFSSPVRSGHIFKAITSSASTKVLLKKLSLNYSWLFFDPFANSIFQFCFFPVNMSLNIWAEKLSLPDASLFNAAPFSFPNSFPLTFTRSLECFNLYEWRLRPILHYLLQIRQIQLSKLFCFCSEIDQSDSHCQHTKLT
jgi:hypothetical protein